MLIFHYWIGAMTLSWTWVTWSRLLYWRIKRRRPWTWGEIVLEGHFLDTRCSILSKGNLSIIIWSISFEYFPRHLKWWLSCVIWTKACGNIYGQLVYSCEYHLGCFKHASIAIFSLYVLLLIKMTCIWLNLTQKTKQMQAHSSIL